MSQVIIDNAPIYEIADILRDKAVVSGKVHLKDMPAAIRSLHGYRTLAKSMPIEPSAYAKTRYSVRGNPHITIAAENTDYLRATAKAVSDVSSMTFVTVASELK